MSELTGKTLGQIGYETYSESTGGKTFDGRPIPTWAEATAAKPHVAKAWEDAASKIGLQACLNWFTRTGNRFSYSEALSLLKLGKQVAREGWNGKGMFIYLVPGSLVEFEQLRGPVRDAAVTATKIEGGVQGSARRVCGHIDMKAADGSLVVGWLASQTDQLAEDWMVVG